jgi:hypothetical protein
MLSIPVLSSDLCLASRNFLRRRTQIQPYTSKPIQEYFKTLLDFVTGVPQPASIYSDRDYDGLMEVLALGERFGVTRLPEMVVPVMSHFARARPWEVFNFAAQNDLPLLASYALDKLDTEVDFGQEAAIYNRSSRLEGIPTKYLVPLVRNLTLFRTKAGLTDWIKVARNYPDLEDVSHAVILVELTPGYLRFLFHDSPTTMRL